MAFIEFGLLRYFLFFPFIHPIFCSLKVFIKKNNITRSKQILLFKLLIFL